MVPIHYDDIDANLAPPGENAYRKAVSPTLEVIKTVGVPQNVPRYSLGYTGTGYGLTYANGMGYGGQFYGPSYLNHQPYKNSPVKRDIVSKWVQLVYRECYEKVDLPQKIKLKQDQIEGL